MIIILAKIIIIFLFFAGSAADVPCPFSTDSELSRNQCKCSDNDPTARSFESAICDTIGTVFPNFFIPKPNDPPIYTIRSKLQITYKVDKITANTFSGFESIGELFLNQSRTPNPTDAVWDTFAFKGVKINKLSIVSLDGLIPPTSGGLKTLGQQGGLSALQITGTRREVQLKNNYWQNFTDLTSLAVESSENMSKIESAAFAGLENKLDELSLKNDRLSDFGQVAQAVSALKNLKRLDLSENRFVSVDLSLLNGMNAVTKFNLKSNGLLKTVIVTNLDQVPSSLKEIDLSNSALETIDPKLNDILNRAGFEKLDLSTDKKIICDSTINWMAKQTFCQPARLTIADAQCGNGTTLEAYLRASVPNPCGSDSSTSSSTSSGPSSSSIPASSTKKPSSASSITANIFLIILTIAIFRA